MKKNRITPMIKTNQDLHNLINFEDIPCLRESLKSICFNFKFLFLLILKGLNIKLKSIYLLCRFGTHLKCVTFEKVATTGRGSAIPVVSTRTASMSYFPETQPCNICENAFARSPRTAQHMHPLSRDITCSSRTFSSAKLFLVNSSSIDISLNYALNILPQAKHLKWYPNSF